MNASLARAVPDGVCYYYSKTFNPQEIHQHVVLYIFNGISPLPKLGIKFKTQHVEKLYGNDFESDFIYNLFGTNENFRHNNFKEFFAFQKKLIKPQPKTQFPNWKLHTLLMQMDSIFPFICMLGVTFYMDKTTMRFKYHHA